jgi:hypothetical protein
MCGWTQGHDVTLDWNREQSVSNNLAGIIGPTIDHTYENNTGYYLITKIPLPIVGGGSVDISALVSPRLPDNVASPMCAEWWFMMHGTDNAELNLYLIPNENFTSVKSIWRRYGDQGNHWQHGQIQIESGDNITRVSYEVILLGNIRSTVSLDDLTLADGPCVKPDFYSIGCTFEDGDICGYHSDPTGVISWTRGQGSTPSLFTGATEGTNLFFSLSFINKNVLF